MADPDGVLDESAETRVLAEADQPIAGPRSDTPPASPVPTSEDPLRIGRYTVLRRLGHGGMGIVYSAYDGELDRKVAIKVLFSRHRGGSLGRARMQREAQALAKLSHPNVVQVFEVGDLDGRVFLAMEYVQGPTLKRWLREQQRSWREILAVYLEAGRGLAAAHAAGLIHRDFKPANAIVGSDGRVRVLDFGLARVDLVSDARVDPAASAGRSRSRSSLRIREAEAALSSSQSIHPSSLLVSEITEAGTLLGTPAYMSPEALDRQLSDARGDLFSFCVALWEALVGARPFVARDDRELRRLIAAGPPASPRGVPKAISRALRRGLAEDPDERPASMLELLAALESGARSGRRAAIVAGVAAALISASAITLVVSQRSANSIAARCDAAADLRGVYDEAIAGEIEGALIDTGVSYAAQTWATIGPRLHAHADALAQARRQSCLSGARGEGGDAPLLAAQSICLDRRRSELSALTTVLRRADPSIPARALATLDALNPVDRCLDLDALRRELDRGALKVTGDDAARVATIEGRLAAARVEQLAERLDRGQALTDEALREAEALGLPGLIAAAQARRGDLRELAGDFPGAREALHIAFTEAERAGDDRLVVDVATSLVRVDGTDLRSLASARIWREVAEAKLARSGDDPGQRLRLLLEAGVALIEGGARDEAVPLFRAALPLAESRREQNPRTYVSALNIHAAAVLQGGGDLEGAEAMMNQAIALQIELTGDDHPYVGMLVYNLGGIQLARHDLLHARANFERALEIRERAYGPDHPDVAQSLNGLAAILIDLDRPADAIRHIERSIAIDERTRGVDHPELIYALGLLAAALRDDGRFDEAEAALLRARRILDDRELQESSPSILIDTYLGDLESSRGRPAAAREHLARALARADAYHSPGHIVPAELALSLAGVDLDLGDEAAARALLARADPVILANDGYGPGPRANLELIRLRLAARDPAGREEAERAGLAALAALRASQDPDRGLIDRYRAWLEPAAAPAPR